MNIPSYLQSSPPRSPHTAPPGIFDTYFKPTPGTSSSSKKSIFFRPTRRDLVLCLLTLSFSYLLFSPPPETTYLPSPGSNRPSSYRFGSGNSNSNSHSGSGSGADHGVSTGGSGSSGGYLGKWSFFHQSDSCPTPEYDQHFVKSYREPSYGESVTPHGLVKPPLANSALLVSSGSLNGMDPSPAKPGSAGADEAVGDVEDGTIVLEPAEEEWDVGEDEDEENEDDELESGATVLKGFQPGWTLVDRLYLYNGSFYVVTTQRSDWPELRLMTSTGLPAYDAPGNLEAREPKGDEILFITPQRAAKLWGPRVYQMDGTSFLFNDGQFIDHYYHFTAELLMGAWRAYSSLDPDITAHGETTLPPPRRIWFLHQNTYEWRDKPRFNPLILFSLFPSVSLLYPDDFQDLKNVTTAHQPKAFVFERALLADRSAAFRGPYTGPTARTVASAMQVGTASRWWWEPLRRQVLRYSGVSEDVIARNLEGYGSVDPSTIKPKVNLEADVSDSSPGSGPVPGAGMGSKVKGGGLGINELEPLSPPGLYKPVVTYISRQSSRRHLTPESHEGLVKALEKRSKEIGFELIIVEAEKMTKEEQFALAARTTVMLGVHGNGLTHLVWMPATPRSTVIEMFFKGGFARDYQWTAHALGIKHFAVQHDVAFTAPNLPPVAYPEGFQGTQITVDGEKVADIVEARLTGTL